MANKEMQFLLYQAEQEQISVNALIRNDDIWLTQKAMSELFGVDKSGISRHLKNIFNEGELDEEVVVAKIAIPTQISTTSKTLSKMSNRLRWNSSLKA